MSENFALNIPISKNHKLLIKGNHSPSTSTKIQQLKCLRREEMCCYEGTHECCLGRYEQKALFNNELKLFKIADYIPQEPIAVPQHSVFQKYSFHELTLIHIKKHIVRGTLSRGNCPETVIRGDNSPVPEGTEHCYF